MPVPAQHAVRNLLLSVLTPEDYAALAAVMEPVVIHAKDVLVVANAPIEYVYFPEAGMVSTVAVTEEGYRIEVGVTGREGFVGTSLVMGVDRTPHESFVQMDATALRLPAAAFVALMEEREALRALLMRYNHVFQLQSVQTALANGAYDITERLARWLLMCADRVDGDEFTLTHEFLSMMLGVRRPGVTTSIHILEGAGQSSSSSRARATASPSASTSGWSTRRSVRVRDGPPGRRTR